jgi:hypothetical protein
MQGPTIPSFESDDDNLKETATKNLFTDIGQTVADLRAASIQISTMFGATRTRLVEIGQSVADLVPRITRLGGVPSDAARIIADVAEATGKNIIIQTESAEKLFAVSELIGESTNRIVQSFGEIGVNYSQVGKQLEGSIKYVASVGLNTQKVMSEVVSQAGQLNRYQFEGGVQGLTKMAAQATMLKFDMGETFRLADSVMNPERAIEVASAFQRLGVSAGNLVDPFQLMNQSINDPSGLQTSLANAVKQFSYFDEQTKTFKINPAGVMKMKEIADQTGISVGELRKMSLAAREVDEILSNISPNIDISDEDKMYLTNIATMSPEGEYTVKIDEKDVKLSEVSNERLKQLIEEQKKLPKTAEDFQRKTLEIDEIIKTDVKAIRTGLVGGFATNQKLFGALERIYEITEATTGSLSDELAKADISRDALNGYIAGAEGFFDTYSKTGNFEEAFKTLSSKIGTENKNLLEQLQGKLMSALEKTDEKLVGKGGTLVEAYKQLALEPAKSAVGIPSRKTTRDYNFNYGGSVKFDINAPSNISTQALQDYVNSRQFQEYVKKLVEQHFKDKNLTK